MKQKDGDDEGMRIGPGDSDRIASRYTYIYIYIIKV